MVPNVTCIMRWRKKNMSFIPDDPDFDINKARLFTTAPRICVRYECVPMRFIKHVYKIHTYRQDGRLFEGKTPVSAFLNSSYDGSFIAGLMELRYIQSLPVERIINYFEGSWLYAEETYGS